jgi:hypothetical protein
MFALQYLSAVFLVFILPGLLIHIARNNGERTDLLETVAHAFGYSLVIVAATGLFLVAVHGNLRIGIAIHACIITALLAWVCRGLYWRQFALRSRCDFPQTASDWALAIPAYMFVVAVVILSYRIEMPGDLGQADCVTLMMAQKMRSLSHLQVDRFMFKPGDTCVYLASMYSYLLALLSSISGLEVVQIYCKARCAFCLLSIAGAYGLSRSLFPRQKQIGYLVLLCICASIWQGWGTSYSPYYFGQFIPTCVYVDVALCVIMPTCFMFYVKALTSDRFYLGFCILETASLLFIHAREFLLLLVLYSACLVASTILCRNKTVLSRGLIIIASCLLAGVLVRQVQKNLVDPNIYQWEAETTGIDSRLSDLMHSENSIHWLYPPLDTPDTTVNNCFYIFAKHPYYLLSALVLPFLFLRGRERGFAMLAGSLTFPLIISCVPLCSLLFIRCTYSQVLFGAPACLGLFPISYIAVAVWLWMLLQVLQNMLPLCRPWYAAVPIAAACGSAVAVGFVCLLISGGWLYDNYQAACYIWVSCGSLAAILLVWVLAKSRLREVWDTTQPAKLSLHLVPGALVAVALLMHLQPVSWAPLSNTSLLTYVHEARQKASVADWEQWYGQSCFRHLPFPLVQMMRELPEGGIFAAPVDDWYLYHIPGLTNQFVYTSGTYTSLVEFSFFEQLYKERTGISLARKMYDDDAFREAYLARVCGGEVPYKDNKKFQHYTGMWHFGDEMMRTMAPIFNDLDSIDETSRLMDVFNIQYIIVPPPYRVKVDAQLCLRPERFERMCAVEGYAVYRVARAQPLGDMTR